MHLRQNASMLLRTQFIFFILTATGCAGASYINARVPDNPLQKVAQQAKQEWSVEWVDENNLHLRNSWPTMSALALGYVASYANLFYDPSVRELNIQYYLKTYTLLYLFIPYSLNAEPELLGAALKPNMNDQIDTILRWSDATIRLRRPGSRFEPFPPYKIKSSDAKPDVVESK